MPCSAPRLQVGIALALVGLGARAPSPAVASDFADSVVDYRPAPGQRVNNPSFNDPARALGAPVGGGTLLQDNTKLVTLGGFGGAIVLKFSTTVQDHPLNPYGLDAIVFGNAIYASGDPNRRFAECGVIEISRDANANGLADDPWYLIPGSHLPPVGAPTRTIAWDNDAGTPTPPVTVSWYPSPAFFPGFPSNYSTSGFEMPALFGVQVLENPFGASSATEGVRGYADHTPVLLLGDLNGDNAAEAPSMPPGDFYTSPDNPFAVGIDPGSCGGDAFDIEWAVDPDTGVAANLSGFDFIRIRTGVDASLGALGEASTEVGGIARVRPRESFFDLTGDGGANIEDLYDQELPAGSPKDLTGDGIVDTTDRAMMLRAVRRSEATDTLQ